MKNLQFIPSIYNYCDRWCERCLKSVQCMVYAHELGICMEELEPPLPPVIHNRFASLIKEAMQYAIEVNTWLNDFQQSLANLVSLTGKREENSFTEVIDACGTIRWYSLQVGVKIKRASSRFEQGADEASMYDRDGSAKVALINLERSINAFAKILKNFPHNEDSILVFLAKLAIIKQEVNHLFPNAESFKRPGFDK